MMKRLLKIKPTFISIFSLNADLFEMLDQTLGRVFDLLHTVFVQYTISYAHVNAVETAGITKSWSFLYS